MMKSIVCMDAHGIAPVSFCAWFLLMIAGPPGVLCLSLDRFTGELKRLANDVLGVAQYQAYQNGLSQQFSNLYFASEAPDGQRLAAQLSAEINQSVNEIKQAVTNLRDTIVNLQFNSSNQKSKLTICCSYNDSIHAWRMSYDVRFRQPVDMSDICLFTTMTSTRMASFADGVLSVFKQNLLDVPSIKFQYFGMEDGNMINFPSSPMCLHDYDPRLRPWYTATEGTPKDVIFIIDRSSQMGDVCSTTGIKRIDFARNITAQMMKHLSGNDRVAVLAMDSSTSTSSTDACFNMELATGTSDNLADLIRFVSSMPVNLARSQANFTNAFIKASQLFNNTRDNTNKGMFSDNDQIIVLLTAGHPVDSMDVIVSTEKTLFNSSVDIFVFDLCPDSTAMEDLISGRGTHSVIRSISDIRASIDSFVSTYVYKDNTNDVIFSIPYMDSNGLGLVTSACLPVMFNAQLQGVTCVDITIDSLFEKLVNFRIGRYSYSFVIDERGRVMLHPLLPHPTTWPELPNFFDLQAVEFSDNSSSLKNNMLSGSAGSMNVYLKWFQANGDSELEGVSKISSLQATYYWSPIPSMKFYICLVMIKGERNSTLTGKVSSTNFILADEFNSYLKPTESQCSRFGELVDTSGSVIKVAPLAFVDQLNYVEKNLTSDDIAALRNILSGWTNQNHYFDVRPGVVESVNVTNYLNSIWLNNSMDVSGYVLSRFICTKEGLHRQYPATKIDKEFDGTEQSWYRNALAHSSSITLNPPSLDSAGNVVIIISQTIPIIGSNDISGVMGISVSYYYMYDLVLNLIDGCGEGQTVNQCFVIDKSGFVIMHRSFLDHPPQNKVHIATVEPEVANDLINSNVFNKDSCVKYTTVSNQMFWEVNTQTSTISFPTGSIYTINGMNAFVIVKNQALTQKCYCNNSTMNKYSDTCEWDDITNNQCECPCVSPLSTYDRCSRNLFINIYQWKPCFPPTSLSLSTNLTFQQIKNMPSCIPCEKYRSRRDCTNGNCFWNEDQRNCSAEILNVPSASSNISSTDLLRQSDPSSNAWKVGVGVGVPIGLIAVSILIVAIAIYMKKRHKAGVYDEAKHVTTVTVQNSVPFREDDGGQLQQPHHLHEGYGSHHHPPHLQLHADDPTVTYQPLNAIV